MPPFRVVSDFEPAGDQPKAIEALARGIERGDRFQTLLGITGSGKSATIAWTIEEVQKPTLVIAPNKSLAAQLANEFKEFFPDNRVEYFVSYYDYYQPEAYIPSSDTYIEKDSSINDEIDRLRHSRHVRPARPEGRHRRRQRVVHLRPGLARGVRHPGPPPPAGRGARPAGHPQPAGRHAVRAQRRELRPGQVPGAGRHHRGLPRLRRDGRAHRALRRRGRAHQPGRPPHRRARRPTSRSSRSSPPPTTWPASSG